MTVLEAIKKSAEFLSRKGVDSPRLQAELLLAHVLSVPRMRLYLDFERVLSPGETDQFRELVRRRGQREPLQYIVGTTSFCGLDITLNRQVLIPRPETEILAERGWKFLNQAHSGGSVCRALDYGSGSGCIAIALAVKCPSVRVRGLDVSEPAIELARQNAQRHRVEHRVEFQQGTGLATLNGDETFDLIISNPPYIPTAEIDSLQPEVRDYEPRTALDGGPDGLNFYRQIASEARSRLGAEGRLCMEMGDSQAERVRTLLEKENWIVEAIEDDYNQHPRVVIAKRSE